MTELSRERREAIDRQLRTGQRDDLTAHELRTLLHGSARLERIERQVLELAEDWRKAPADKDSEECANELRAIVDTGGNYENIL